MKCTCELVQDQCYEACSVYIAKKLFTVTIAAENCVIAHTIDDLETVAQFCDPKAHTVFTFPTDIDVVLSFSSENERTSLTDELKQLKKIRSAVNTSHKLIFCEYDCSFQEYLSKNKDCLRKQRNESSAGFLFPHTRLDFLKLHANKSVMAKLTAYGDKSIDFSDDNVKVYCSSCTSSPRESIDPVFVQLKSGRSNVELPDQSLECNFVVILTEKALYVTQKTGKVVERVVICDAGGVWILATNEQTSIALESKEQRVIIQSKYAKDIFRRIAANVPSIVPSESLRPSALERVLSLPDEPTQCCVQSSAERSEAVQTLAVVLVDACSTTDFPLGDYLSVQRANEMKAELAHRDITLRLLQQRCENLALAPARSKSPVSTRGSEKNPKDQHEIDLLRHYCCLLEHEIHSDEKKRLKERIEFLENEKVFSASAQDLTKLQYALVEAERHQQRIEDENEVLRRQLQAITKSTNTILEEMGTKVTKAVQEFVTSYQSVCNKTNRLSWERLAEHLQGMDERIDQEVAARSCDLLATNATLVDELRRRETELDHLNEQLALSFTSSNVIPSNAATREFVASQAELDTLRKEVRRLTRHREELQAAVDLLAQEARLQIQQQDDATMGSLQEQVAELKKLQTIPLAINKIAQLEMLALEVEKYKDELASIRAEQKTHSTQTAQKIKAAQKTAEELASARSRCQTLQAQVERLEETVKSFELVAEKTRHEHELELRELKRQVRYHRERIHELLRAKSAKVTQHVNASAPSTPRGGRCPTPSTPRLTSGTPTEPPQPILCEGVTSSPANNELTGVIEENRKLREELSEQRKIFESRMNDALAAMRNQPREEIRLSPEEEHNISSPPPNPPTSALTIEEKMGVVSEDNIEKSDGVESMKHHLELLHERALRMRLEKERGDAEDQIARLNAELLLAKRPAAPHRSRSPSTPSVKRSIVRPPSQTPSQDPIELARQRLAMLQGRKKFP